MGGVRGWRDNVRSRRAEPPHFLCETASQPGGLAVRVHPNDRRWPRAATTMGGPGEALGRGGAGQRAGAAASAFHGGGRRVVPAGNQQEEAMAVGTALDGRASPPGALGPESHAMSARTGRSLRARGAARLGASRIRPEERRASCGCGWSGWRSGELARTSDLRGCGWPPTSATWGRPARPRWGPWHDDGGEPRSPGASGRSSSARRGWCWGRFRAAAPDGTGAPAAGCWHRRQCSDPGDACVPIVLQPALMQG